MKDMIGYCGLDCGDCPDLETCPTARAILENNSAALENLKE